jgi:autotransporter passenger strand-loop-strand repeat protein
MTSTITVSSGVTSDITLSLSVYMDVFSSGSTLFITVASGGNETVYSGGISTSTMVDRGGVLNVFGGGTDYNAYLSQGVENVSGGGVAHESILSGGFATQNILSGGLAIRAELFGGTQNVSSGGTAIDTVARIAFIDVSSGGTTVSSYLGLRAAEQVDRGGIAYDTKLVAGTLQVDGGETSGTVVGNGYVRSREIINLGGSAIGSVVMSRGGQLVLHGTTTGTILSGGAEVVAGSDAEAYGTKIYAGGDFFYESGGRAVGTIVESGGTYTIGGHMNDGTVGLLVSGGGTEILSSDLPSSSTSATILGGGTELVSAGATVIDTQLFGSSTVDSGGLTSGATVNAGGIELVQSGGIVNGATIAGGILNADTSYISGPIDFTSTGGEMIIGTKTIPTSFVVSGFASGDSIQLAAVTYSAGATVAVDTPGVVTITNGGQEYNLNIAGATVGETDFVFTSGSILTKETTPQMQFLRPHVVPVGTGLDLNPGPEMFAARGATMNPAAAPAMATSATASIGAVPTIVTSAPHPLVVPPHGV